MLGNILTELQKEIQNIKDAGLYKTERIITTPQGAVIRTNTGSEVLNFCANNYLGLSSHPEVVAAAKNTLTLMVLECLRSDLSVGHKTFTKSWNQKFPLSLGWKMQYFMRQHLMQTEDI